MVHIFEDGAKARTMNVLHFKTEPDQLLSLLLRPELPRGQYSVLLEYQELMFLVEYIVMKRDEGGLEREN